MTERAIVPVDPSKRTIVRYPVEGDPWPVITEWALEHRFQPRGPQTPAVKLFQRGMGLLTAPARAQFIHRGSHVEVQAWIHIALFTRIIALFTLPAEVHVRSGGITAALPRRTARKAINELLSRVGAEPIP